MPELLLELFSEEIPARMQQGAARDLERLMVGALTDRGFLFEGIKAFAGPRRLTLAVSGLPPKQRDVREELKGPKTDAPQAALDGFLKKTGLTKTQLKVEKTPKGDVYIAVIERAGRETKEVLAEILPETLPKLPWPKSMRWPQGQQAVAWTNAAGQPMQWTNNKGEPIQWQSGVRWVRPLHSIIATFDGEVVPFTFAGVTSGNTTKGHRFLSQGTLTVRRFEDYEAALKKAHVVLDAEERKAIIFENLKSDAFAIGLELIPDEGLLNEVAGLAEWPVVLLGAIPDQFMDLPPEILQTSMRTHQKYFSLRDSKTGKMASRFALVANMVAEDGGKDIVAGNERVLRARLSDASYFWFMDRQWRPDNKVIELFDVIYHAELGSQFDRSLRLAVLSGLIAERVGGNHSLAQRAGWLAKTDLVSGVVGEFPELQGIMGSYYALNAKESPQVALAIRDQYRPQGPSDTVPTAPNSISLALADKLDALVGFFRIGQKPTGSGDPYALRRSALGVIRIILHNNLRIELSSLIASAYRLISLENIALRYLNRSNKTPISLVGTPEFRIEEQKVFDETMEDLVSICTKGASKIELTNDLLVFFADRLKVALKEKGIRHDLIDAVFALGHEDDLVRLVARVEALQAFLKTEDGTNLLAGYKRAANILKVEEKKDAKTYISEVTEGLLAAPPEKNLYTALAQAKSGIAPALKNEDYALAMRQMAALRGPVDAFFDGVKVNDDNPKLRENRLNLLASLRAALHQVADFSKIEG